MGIVTLLLFIAFILSAILLMLLVLIQDDEGEGVTGMFGGGSATPFGSRSGNVLTRLTSILGAIFLFTAFGLAWVNRSPETSDVIRKARVERLKETEKNDWWVEKIETPAAPSPENPDTSNLQSGAAPQNP